MSRTPAEGTNYNRESGDSGSNDGDGNGAWNPGIESKIPRRLQAQVTLFRDSNAQLDYSDAAELSELTGLAAIELATFRAERLVVHELLVRVTADLSVPDGPNYEDLGINLRGMVASILERHVTPQMPLIRSAFDAERERAAEVIDGHLSADLYLSRSGPETTPTTIPKPSTKPSMKNGSIEKSLAARFASLFSRAVKHERQGSDDTDASVRTLGAAAPLLPIPDPLVAVQKWRDHLSDISTTSGATDSGGTLGGTPGGSADDTSDLNRACLDALVRTVGGIVGQRGRLIADDALIRRIAVNLVSNERGALAIGALIGPIMNTAIASEGYRRLPAQAKPVIMNVKGASASGKSTIRPQQRLLAKKLDIPWEDFALISPDYWRKFLLDYPSLGDDFRYGAMLTGQELEIIDKKLDRYMAYKASCQAMSHLLIDRFRFDSFTLDPDRTAGSRLLTRFGHRVYLFFMVTPPNETVERAWIRGNKTGRYKAVSDLLYHNVEAFTGMPALFLSWVDSRDKKVHFEFLDNDVPEGSLPKTAAFGWNDCMTILDIERMLDIDRYRKVNIDARRPGDVLPAAELGAAQNLEFILKCRERIGEIVFADPDTEVIYARLLQGKLVWWDDVYLAKLDPLHSSRVVLDALGHNAGTAPTGSDRDGTPIDFRRERQATVGRWAEASSA